MIGLDVVGQEGARARGGTSAGRGAVAGPEEWVAGGAAGTACLSAREPGASTHVGPPPPPQVQSKDLILGGGNLHCLSQQQPATPPAAKA